MKQIIIILSMAVFGLSQITEIYDIQYSDSLGSGDDCYSSSFVNQENITIRGVVTAVENNSSYHTFFVQDPDSVGTWNGIYVFNNSLQPSVGNYVSVTGKVTEYYGLTEIGYLSVSNVLIQDYQLPAPIVISTSELNGGCSFEAEKFESVLIELQNVTVTQSPDSYGQWFVDDGSGACEIDDMFYSYDAQVGDEILTLRGVVKYSYGEYEVNPRDVADIVFAGAPTIGNVEISPALPSEIDTITVSANIVDDGVFTVTLSVSFDGGATWSDFPMNSISGDSYETIIPATNEGNMTIYYKITALDDDGMATIYPEDGWIEIFIYPFPYPISALHVNDEDGIPLLLDSEVTITGMVTVADEFNNPFFLEDETAGVAVYDGTALNQVVLGDEIMISGTVTNYMGLTEIGSVQTLEIISSGNTISPQIVTIGDLVQEGSGGIENFEGEIFQIYNVTVEADTWSGNTNYQISDGTGIIELRIDGDTDIPGNVAPTGSFDLIGVISQFDASSPYTSGYQLMPRSMTDIIFTEGPEFAVSPHILDLWSGEVVISWETIEPTTAVVNYGPTTAYEEGSVAVPESQTYHEITLSNLTSATLYHYEVVAGNALGETSSGDYFFMSVSTGSSGEIQVLFTQDVDHEYAFGNDLAQGDVDAIAVLTERIEAAQYSIDVTAYSWSLYGLSDVLIDAYNRGVAVRFIYDSEHSQGAAQDVEDAGIPIISNDEGVGETFGIMHNKFIVIDARDYSTETDDYVFTGSMNYTTEGAYSDMQNCLLIQDAALARAYTIEFNEMWGSENDQPNIDLARFGENKFDNTPHLFRVNEIPMELYFSPSDGVTDKIIETIQTANESILFGILSFTRDDISGAMHAQFNNDIPVRGIFDPSVGTGTEWDDMSLWADVHLDVETGLMHHKYLLVDACDPSSDPTVLTGSHNWSNSAENSNDENTLIIYDANIVGQYLQEFARRYENSAGISLPVPDVGCAIGDLNQDENINVLDVIILINIVLDINENPSEWELCAGDADENGLWNVLDVIQIINMILSGE